DAAPPVQLGGAGDGRAATQSRVEVELQILSAEALVAGRGQRAGSLIHLLVVVEEPEVQAPTIGSCGDSLAGQLAHLELHDWGGRIGRGVPDGPGHSDLLAVAGVVLVR